MNAIAQALAELANRNADRCTVEEIIEAPAATETPAAVEAQVDSRTRMLVDTMVVFANISADTLLMSDIIRRSGGTSVYIMQKNEKYLDELVKTVNDSTSVTRVVTDFASMPIEAFVRIINETKVDVVVINQNPENHEAITLIVSKIREQITCNLDDRFILQQYPEDRTYTQVYADYLKLSQWFTHQEIYNAYTSNQEFRRKIFLMYINEIPYVQVDEWTNVRLFNLATVNSNDIIYTAFVMSQANKHRNNFSKVSDNLIASDYQYTDAFDYTEFIRALHNDSTKLYDKVNFFLLFSTRYNYDNTTNVTTVRVVSYDSQENNQRVLDALKSHMTDGQLQVSDLGGAILLTGNTVQARSTLVKVVCDALTTECSATETVVVPT